MADYCDGEGARKIAARIRDYWYQRGYVVDVSLVDAPFVPAMRTARVDVRSNMVNGLPRRTLRDRSKG